MDHRGPDATLTSPYDRSNVAYRHRWCLSGFQLSFASILFLASHIR
ncbi:hypothetical protein RB1877 [Rhodopirellula baltica SH 1]|uniref:Uncharacterized protein n=1 Tax=Rhodopirellula baltica (strain DSM 10527 / NCIMB 13988 / SH1) TaxID=243090 RepID=Q7UWQ2_RHOBA|nr:hypothetical protein RB1877 [Rhodopirellula baltica SH 1]